MSQRLRPLRVFVFLLVVVAERLSRLFYGTLKQRLSFVPGDASIHEKEVLFSLLPVNVSDEGYDLYDGLGSYFDDAVEFEGKAARMEVTLVDLPPLLQIQLQVRPVPLGVFF